MEDLDLTLKLGLPNSDQSVHDTSLSLKTPMLNQVLAIGGGDNEGKSADEFLGGPYDEGAVNNMNVNLMVSNFIMKTFSGSARGVAFSGNSGEVNLAPPAAVGNGYVLLDVPSRRAERERVLANALDVNGPGGSSRGSGRHRGGNCNEENKRCTNINCNTTDTPMWRRGPLGPKTLCNACGIKYRKEEERKKAREATNSRENGNRLLTNQVYFNVPEYRD